MKKIEVIVFSISFVALIFLHHFSFSSYLGYFFIVIYIGLLIAPEFSPENFKSPHIFQLGIGIMTGVFASYALNVEPKTFIALVSIFACIGILTPFWVKILNYA